MINHPERKNYDLSSLKYMLVGASTVPRDLMVKIKNDIKIKNVIVNNKVDILLVFVISFCHMFNVFKERIWNDRIIVRFDFKIILARKSNLKLCTILKVPLA